MYRTVDCMVRIIDFHLSSRRNSKAAYPFLAEILNNAK